ncbi:MAG: AmmeMemoRadiSam system protein A [Proteobacteria bacterium]|nr:AmmeMemoRadiSam system protein A [Pseudomonadota bacterium]MBU1641679.1 AmmeMemoRadiSam system protein A [Pseudomonadota bacterium]
MSTLLKEQGDILVRLAKSTIATLLGAKQAEQITPQELSAPEFQEKRGVFVTLHKKGQLRGCVGSLTGSETILEAIRHQAENAAFYDSRFNRVQADELPDIKVEISILSEPAPLTFSDPEDLVRKVRPQIDGVILSCGRHQATFLPQVWDQLPDPKDFLGHLAMKAGLLREGWKNKGVEISTYQVQHFGEQND